MSNLPIDNRVQLGCGSLLLIGLIVIVFSGGNDSRELHRQLDEMKVLVAKLNESIDALSKEVGALRERRPAPPAGQ